jgi:probable rRNA maturation factor
MSELHLRFLKIAGPTDVITFQHGEIFVSVETARRAAREHRTSTPEEIQLYIVHGLLHLSGFDDKTKAEAREMQNVQRRIARRAREGAIRGF